jgi:hypothetical protein
VAECSPSVDMRRQEVAKRLGISYDVLDNHDGELLPTLEIRLDVIRKSIFNEENVPLIIET